MQRDPATWSSGYDEDNPPPDWLIGNGKAAHGLPSQQLGRWLAAFKRSGCPDFSTAWEAAWSRTRWPQCSISRREWHRAAAWARPWFERAWYGREVPDVHVLLPSPDEHHREVEHESHLLA